MFRRRRDQGTDAQLAGVFEAFREVLGAVEEAMAHLSSVAPGGRSVGVPLAEALAGFDQELGRAARGMPAWRRPEVEAEWAACRDALAAATGRADALRLGEAPPGYEQLYGVLGDIIAPLEAFDAAGRRFRRLGLRG